MAWIDPEHAWPGLRSIAAAMGERRIGEMITRETCFYLTSLPG